MLDIDKEDKPRGQRYETLHHHPHRHAEDRALALDVESRETRQSEMSAIDFRTRIADKKYQRHKFGKRRAYRRAGDSERGQAAFAKHEHIVEHHIRQHHYNGVERESLCLRRAHIKRPEHTAGKGKEEAIDTPMDIVLRLGKNVGRGNHHRQNFIGIHLAYDKQHRGKRHQEIQALVEHLPHLTITPFAIASRNQNLRTHTESVASHKDNHIEHSSNSRCAKFHLADTPHKSRVGKRYHLFHQKAYQNRISHSPNLFITIIDRCCHRAAKLLQFGENRAIPL